MSKDRTQTVIEATIPCDCWLHHGTGITTEQHAAAYRIECEAYDEKFDREQAARRLASGSGFLTAYLTAQA